MELYGLYVFNLSLSFSSILIFFSILNIFTDSDDHCLSAFTEQQGWLMLYYVVTSRPSFASSSWEALGGTACVAGQYHDGTSCQSCPANTFNTKSNCTSGESCCESCPTGKFSESTGAMNEYGCEYCELDKVANCQSRLSAGTSYISFSHSHLLRARESLKHQHSNTGTLDCNDSSQYANCQLTCGCACNGNAILADLTLTESEVRSGT